jgi:diguanylate cyclase (GGDEF)-like protein
VRAHARVSTRLKSPAPGPITATGVSNTRLEILEQVLAAVPSALAYVDDARMLYENDRMGALAADLRDGALAAAREHGSTFVELVGEQGDPAPIWRFEFHRASDRGVVVVGTDVTAARQIEGRLEDLLAYEQSARALTEHEKHSLAEEKVLLEQVASTDPLTGLVNRRAFADALQRNLAQGAERQLAVALLYMDLDGFKQVNDTSGHAAGDALLAEVAHRLHGCVRGNDVAARLGGDEFALLLCDLPCDVAAQAAATVAERALAAMRTPVELDDGTHFVGVSVGVALGAPGALDADALVAAADAAMYAAKRAGGRRVVTAEPAIAACAPSDAA